MSEPGSTSIIIAERGADWSPWVERFRSESSKVTVIQQEDDETITEFAQRVRSRFDENSGCSIPARAVLVGGGRQDGAVLAARSLAIRAMAASMGENGGGSVLLSGSGKDRFSMAALAATVSMLVYGSSVTVKHAARPASAIRAA